MRVYSYGHIKPMYVFCRGCGAVLEFNSREVRLTNYCIAHGAQDDGKDYFIKCPVCSYTLYDKDFKATPDEC
jgi:hypothetical protein